MPPKSASKREKPLWTTCPTCLLHILGPNSGEHLKTCQKEGQPACYIDPNKAEFSTNRLETRSEFAEEKNFPKSQLNSLIFLNIQVLRFCQFVIGEEVLCTLGDGRRIVKRVWPVGDKSLEVVRATKDTVKQFGDFKALKVTRISNIRNAVEVKVRCEEAALTPDLSKNLTLLFGEFETQTYKEGDILEILYLNKSFLFTIVKVTSEEEDLVANLEALTIGDKFFKFTRRTNFVIVSSAYREVDIDSAVKERTILIGGLERQEAEILEIIQATQSKGPRGGLTKGILVHGAPGCGKTLLLKSILRKSALPVITINGSEIFSRYYGETESNLTTAFGKLKAEAFSLIVIEDIHNLCPKAESSDIVRRVTSALIDQMDQLPSRQALILATTNQIDNLHAGIRRSGRLDYEVEVPVPNPSAREKIIEKLLEKHQTKFSVADIKELALTTHGYTGADLDCLITKTFYSVKGDAIQFYDVQHCLQIVKPSAMREVQIESPNIKWTDIGGQSDLKLKLQQVVEWPIRHPETFTRLGITPPRGLLMFGPPGCSKTMIAKALATESGLNFLSIKGSELFSMWVGESEKAVQKVFAKAREVAPSIVFFDEIDAIGGERDGGTSVKERVLAQILTEIDGVHVLKDVTIVAATNRPDLIDPALMRPGRLDRVIYVGLPDMETRREIFKIKLAKTPAEIDVEELVQKTEGYSGAEIQAVVQEAALHALEMSQEAKIVSRDDFMYALDCVQPRTSPELMKLYNDYLQKYRYK